MEEINPKGTRIIRVGTWGKQNGGPQNNWSFEVEECHKLQSIKIDHDDSVIYSLMFTTECRGVMSTSKKIGGWNGGQTVSQVHKITGLFQLERNYHLMKIIIDHGDLIYSLMFTSQCGDMTRTFKKFGGWNGGENVSEITFEGNEEIKAIRGTVALSRGNDAGNTIVSSISFVTNKRTHGPFGNERRTSFLVPWEYGSFAGFYGLCGYYIDSIGVYVKAPDEIMKIGTWGKSIPAGPQNNWSFQFERNYHLMKITIDHGDLIYSLMFTSQCGDITHTSKKFGGWNGGEIVSEITFEGNEEIKAISGTVALSRGTDAGNTIISSISFLTNKRTHGPFGNVRGTPFSVPWEYGSLAGFYGLCGYYIDSIGVYLRATKR